MRFLLSAFGSHGDVHPFIGLGQVLRSRGHDVAVAASAEFVSLIESTGLAAIGLGEPGEFKRMASNPDVWHPRRGAPTIWNGVLDVTEASYRTLFRHASHDTIVVGSTLSLAARAVAEVKGLRWASVHLQPIVFYSTTAMPVLPGVPRVVTKLPPFVLERVYDGADRYVLDPMIAPRLNAFRATLGLPAVDKIMREHIHAPGLTIGFWPEWFAPRQDDWPAQARLAGFPMYDESDVTPLPDELVKFLDDGDPPVAFTPGSAMLFGRRFFTAAAEACRRAGLRGLLLTRHAENVPGDLPPGVIHVPYAPFGKLLPRCSALVFHGGVGTMSQALAAGVPQLVMPMAHDQFDNAARAKRLGVGDELSVRRFKPKPLAKKLTRLTSDPAVRTACKKIAGNFDGTPGTRRAADLLESVFVNPSESVL